MPRQDQQLIKTVNVRAWLASTLVSTDEACPVYRNFKTRSRPSGSRRTRLTCPKSLVRPRAVVLDWAAQETDGSCSSQQSSDRRARERLHAGLYECTLELTG